MKDKDIQLLIDKYLDGATSPEEEKRLARELSRADVPLEWEAIKMMLGELAMGEAAYDEMMTKGQTPSYTTSPKRPRGWMTALAVAASLALLLLLAWPKGQEGNQPLAVRGHKQEKVNDTKENTHFEPAKDHVATLEQSPEQNAVNNIEKTPKMKEHRLSITQKTTTHMETVASISNTLYEDTLGNGIWQSKKNIVLAEEMLKDCEMTIRKSGQAIRNEVMEASFHALPQKPNFRLVIDEEGDYVITDDTQPSPVRL